MSIIDQFKQFEDQVNAEDNAELERLQEEEAAQD